MSEPTCDNCNKPISDFWEDPPTCNRCLVLDIITTAVSSNVCRNCEPDDITATAEAVLNALLDNAYELGHDSLVREYLTQTGWR